MNCSRGFCFPDPQKNVAETQEEGRALRPEPVSLPGALKSFP
jgi:hypothetical protein